MNPNEHQPVTPESELVRTFVIGEEVKVARNMFDPETAQPTGETFIEDGWRVMDTSESPNGESIVTVQLPEPGEDPFVTKRLLPTKRYLAKQLATFQDVPEYRTDTSNSAVPEDDLEIVASKSILGFVDDEQHASPEIIAEIEHIQEELGETAVEGTGIEEPKLFENDENEQLEGALADAKIAYDRQAEMALELLTGNVQGRLAQLKELTQALNVSVAITGRLDEERESLDRLVREVEAGDYDVTAVRTKLGSALQATHVAYASFRGARSVIGDDISQPTRAMIDSIEGSEFEFHKLDQNFNEHVRQIYTQHSIEADETIPVADSDTHRADIEALKPVVDEVLKSVFYTNKLVSEQGSSLALVVRHIDSVIASVQEGRLDAGEINAASHSLAASIEAARKVATFNATTLENLSIARAALTKLQPE